MDLEVIILNEIRETKTNTICFQLFVEYKEQIKHTIKIETDLIDTESRLVVAIVD